MMVSLGQKVSGEERGQGWAPPHPCTRSPYPYAFIQPKPSALCVYIAHCRTGGDSYSNLSWLCCRPPHNFRLFHANEDEVWVEAILHCEQPFSEHRVSSLGGVIVGLGREQGKDRVGVLK